jgi:hypothetical protein
MEPGPYFDSIESRADPAGSASHRSKEFPEMNVHEGLLSELVRQRQLHLLDDAKHWTSRVKLRRRAQRDRVAA